MLIIYILTTVLQRENQMLIRRNPETVAAPPNGRYSHSVETPENSRWLHIAGQVGIKPDGTIPKTIEEQDDQVWKNTMLVLEDAGFGPDDIVKMTIYSTDPNCIDSHMENRKKYLNEGKMPATTWLNISSLATPALLIEMEAIAAKKV